MPFLPRVPNYEQTLFVDVPAVDYVTGTLAVIVNNKVSTPAVQRIGMEELHFVSSSTYLALTGSDGAKLGFGERVGAVTVFGGEPGITGSATQQINSRRQGVSVRTLNQFDSLLCPLIRLTDDPLIRAGIKGQNTFIDHRASRSTFGQPKLFLDPIENSAENAFFDLPGIFNPKLFLDKSSTYIAYPAVWDASTWLQPDQLDGVIEVFDIRRTFSNTSIIDLPYLKGIKGNLEGGYLNNLKGTTQITSVFELQDLNTDKDYFEDAQEQLFTEVNFPSSSYAPPTDGTGGDLRFTGKFALPGFVSLGENIESPFNDAADYLTGSYTFMNETQITDLLRINTTSSFQEMSAIGTRFKSSTCGFTFGESNAMGTDSIAFGGFLK